MLNGIAEGQTVHLTVDRSQGSYRSVRVNWNCGSQSQNDFSPWNGQLVFAEVCKQVLPKAPSSVTIDHFHKDINSFETLP